MIANRSFECAFVRVSRSERTQIVNSLCKYEELDIIMLKSCRKFVRLRLLKGIWPISVHWPVFNEGNGAFVGAQDVYTI